MQKSTRLAAVIAASFYALYYIETYKDWHFVDNVDLIFHEAGHTIFSFLPEFFYIAAGSGFQILLPLLIALYFFYNKQNTSGSVCLLWVGVNLLNVSVYAGDAQAMNLSLLGGDSSIHDWNYILNSLGVLRHTAGIAQSIYVLGILAIGIGVILAFNFVLKTDFTKPRLLP